jgi:hypothetical protein
MFVRISEIFCNNTLPPSYNYNEVMKELKQVYCHPRCFDDCKYIAEFKDGSFLRRPILIGQYSKICSECKVSKVSRREHEVCHACAKRYINPIEFSYHHGICPSWNL